MDQTINQLHAEEILDIAVSTDDPEIASAAQSRGCAVVNRPQELADDSASADLALLHAVADLGLSDADIVLMPQLTSPLRNTGCFRGAAELLGQAGCDSVFSGVRMDDICVWRLEHDWAPLTYDPLSRLNRQQAFTTVVENGSFYAMFVSTLKRCRNRIGDKPLCYEMPKWTLFEIDELEDVQLLEVIAKEFRN